MLFITVKRGKEEKPEVKVEPVIDVQAKTLKLNKEALSKLGDVENLHVAITGSINGSHFLVPVDASIPGARKVSDGVFGAGLGLKQLGAIANRFRVSDAEELTDPGSGAKFTGYKLEPFHNDNKIIRGKAKAAQVAPAPESPTPQTVVANLEDEFAQAAGV